jgi:hypothetical protein
MQFAFVGCCCCCCCCCCFKEHEWPQNNDGNLTPLKIRLGCFTPLIFDSSKLTRLNFRGVADSPH